MARGPRGRYNKLLKELEERRALLLRFGGLDLNLVRVANEEWLYMLQEDTRNSLAIEGYFTKLLSRMPRISMRGGSESRSQSGATSKTGFVV
jgi:hypothetical protein